MVHDKRSVPIHGGVHEASYKLDISSGIQTREEIGGWVQRKDYQLDLTAGK